MLQIHGYSILIHEGDLTTLSPEKLLCLKSVEYTLQTSLERGVRKLATHIVGTVLERGGLEWLAILHLEQSVVD
jgi:hypothetical protein